MRRPLLPPPGMWPRERPIVHVLNGDYPAAHLRRMSVPGLERLVARLVQCTSRAASKPKWWPSGLHFTHPLDLGLSGEREIRLKQLIVSCCQFFAADENRRRKRPRPREPDAGKRRAAPSPSKHQFLHYFRLGPRRVKATESAPPPPPPPATTAKLATCIHIPFSSDVGRIMAKRENHAMNEELKMRRLERSEWYTNKGPPRAGEVEFEVAAVKEPGHSHVYKMPKRQQHQRRRSLRNADFLARFCTPLSVVLTRLDLEKIKSDQKRQLVVMIRDTEKMCCDLRRDVKNVRTSPRLRNV